MAYRSSGWVFRRDLDLHQGLEVQPVAGGRRVLDRRKYSLAIRAAPLPVLKPDRRSQTLRPGGHSRTWPPRQPPRTKLTARPPVAAGVPPAQDPRTSRHLRTSVERSWPGSTAPRFAGAPAWTSRQPPLGIAARGLPCSPAAQSREPDSETVPFGARDHGLEQVSL